MKKNLFLFASAIVLLFAMNSCKSDSDSSGLDLDKTLEFSKLTVEQQKQSIEQSGIDLVSKMDAMKDTKGMIAIVQFVSYQNGSKTLTNSFRQLQSNLVTQNAKSLDVFNQQLRVAANVGDSIWGDWTYNVNTKKFVLTTKLVNKAVFRFPATATASNNNGELTINYAESNIAVPGNPKELLPSSFSVVLKVDGTVALSANFEGTYKADGTPTKLLQSLVIDKYNWTAELTNNDKDVSSKYAFNVDKETLLKVELAASGNFSAGSLNANSNPQDFITTGVMSFQVLNIAFLGGFKDFPAFVTEMNAVPVTNDKTYADKQVLVINKYLKLYGYFVKENVKFADVEFYVVERMESVYNPITRQYENKIRYDFQPRLILSDGSKVDIKTFVSTGFDDLITQLQGFLN